METEDKNKKLYIIAGILLIIAFVIATNFIKNNLNSKIDYNSDNVVADLMKSATITYDRKTYYELEGIITKYISSYNKEVLAEDQLSYEEYYDVLEEEYKSKLSKAKYKEVAQIFFKSVEYTNSSSMDSMTTIVTTNIIRSIYDLGDNRYLCMVGISNNTKVGYIGIELVPSNNTYSIFYLE